MPTVNPRINVTLPPSLDALVGRMAVHQRISKSQVLRELLEAAEPALQRAVALMEAASQASAEVRKGFAASLDRAQVKAEKAAADLVRQLDTSTQDLVSLAEAVRGRRPRRPAPPAYAAGAPAGVVPGGAGSAAVGEDPPSSKRGVRSPPRGAEGVYSALNPSTGERQLLPVGKAFGKDGAVVDVKPRRGSR